MRARPLSPSLHLLPRGPAALPYLDAAQLRSWYGRLPAALQQALQTLSTTRVYDDGELLFAKGERPAGLYGITAGEVRASSLADDGKEVILFIFETGSWFGLISAFDQGVSPADCRSLGRTVVRLLPQQALDALLAEHPQYYRHFGVLMCAWLRIALDLVEDQVLLTLRRRLAKRLLHLANTHGRSVEDGCLIDLQLPQEELGRLLGATRQSINKELRWLRDSGCIRTHASSIVVTDAAALAALAATGTG